MCRFTYPPVKCLTGRFCLVCVVGQTESIFTPLFFFSKFAQVVGKVSPNQSINAYSLTSAGDNFDMDNYNKFVELSTGKFRSLFM